MGCGIKRSRMPSPLWQIVRPDAALPSRRRRCPFNLRSARRRCSILRRTSGRPLGVGPSRATAVTIPTLVDPWLVAGQVRLSSRSIRLPCRQCGYGARARITIWRPAGARVSVSTIFPTPMAVPGSPRFLPLSARRATLAAANFTDSSAPHRMAPRHPTLSATSRVVATLGPLTFHDRKSVARFASPTAGVVGRTKRRCSLVMMPGHWPYGGPSRPRDDKSIGSISKS